MIAINFIVGGLFIYWAIHFYRKHKEAKVEFVATKDTGYRTLSRMNLFLCVVFSLVVLNNVALIINQLIG